MNTQYENKIKEEISIYKDQVNVHELPEIFHYWSHNYIRPMHEEFGIANSEDLFVQYFLKSANKASMDKKFYFISIGSGNCDTEIFVAKKLVESGLTNFIIECIEINPHMVERGKQNAIQNGLGQYISFVIADFNKWVPDKKYHAVMANQSLHHVVELEHLFSSVKNALFDDGYFVISDMIGRNGHQRWPEALKEVNKIWGGLPSSYKYNHIHKRQEETYINHDCSSEGFEGVRAQDILPLLVSQFNFDLFVPFGNITFVFVDRCFGHNFDVNSEHDRNLIDSIHELDEKLILQGKVSPTQMMAAVCKANVTDPKYSRGLLPEKCVYKF